MSLLRGVRSDHCFSKLKNAKPCSKRDRELMAKRARRRTIIMKLTLRKYLEGAYRCSSDEQFQSGIIPITMLLGEFLD